MTNFKISNRNFNVSRILIILSLLFLMFIITGCDDRNIDPNRVRVSELYTSGDVLYNDNGNTYIYLTARVIDHNEFPLAGQEVRFKSNVPEISFLPATEEDLGFLSNNAGLVKAMVWVSDDALRGIDQKVADLEAYIGTNFQKAIPVTIKKNVGVDSIAISSTIPATVTVDQSIQIRARLTSSDPNVAIPNGTMVTFETTDRGHFVDADGNTYDSAIQVAVKNNEAVITYNTGFSAGTTTIRASIGANIAEKSTTIMPGAPSVIFLQADQTVVMVNDTTDVYVHALLTDEYTNPIKNKMVSFTTSLGNIFPISQNTDEDGVASVQFIPGANSGNAEVSAIADSAQASTMIQVISGGVQSLRWTNTNSIGLNVQGTGGIESQSIGVKLYDMSGNIVTSQHKVRFSILSAPAGVTMNNENAAYQDVFSYGGEAMVSISAGQNSGNVTLKAVVLGENDIPTAVHIQRANIVIHAGPAATIQLYLPNVAATDISDGSWEMILAAKINDRWGNPVSDGLGVTFSVNETSAFGDSISINTAAYTGNVSAAEDSAQGHAFTELVYHGRLSNETISISAETSGEIDGNAVVLNTEMDLVLPMNEIRIELVAVPPFIEWYLNGAPVVPNGIPEKSTEIRVIVKDGQSNPLRKVPLIFSSTRGYFKDDQQDPSAEIPPDATNSPNDAITNTNGMQIKKFYASGFFAPPAENPPMEAVADVRVHILGYDNIYQAESIALRVWWPF
jgi:hypothetical protein